MKKYVCLSLILMLYSMCFCREIKSDFICNIDTDSIARYQVGTFAIATCQDIVKGKTEYDFKRVDNNNLGAYLISKECMDDVYDKYSIRLGDLYRSIYLLTDNITVLMFLYKTHESPLAWRYYCYMITFSEENK